MRALGVEWWKAVGPFLDQALALTGQEQATWLASLRETDAGLADELTRLLREHSALQAEHFLEDASPSLSLAPPWQAGLVAGAYTLRRLIGHGGMGSVWLAERSDGRFEGVAAVKLLGASRLGPEGEARFRREGSILARLRHPHVAHLIDAGVTEVGHPYLVLEFVDGERIDRYCDARNLSLEQRIRLLLDVLDAVGHAHANLIVHRDLKPSNILVTKDGTAKLLDFGIAKLLAAERGEEETALTRDGRALTPEFAAPEQVRGEAITTATDIYAIGVILYRLLTGRPPYELGSGSAAEIERVICETEPPPPSAVFPRLGADLDVIVQKALRKEPERRYQSAAALQDDLRRFLDGRPVLARPDTAAYRLRKFVGRHRTGVALATAAAFLLAGATIRERALRARADAEAHKETAVKEFLVSVFRGADPTTPTAGGDVTARALVDRGAARVDSSLGGEPAVQAELRGVLGSVYTSLGAYDKAVPLLQRSLDQRRALYGPRHPAVAEAMDLLGAALMAQDKFDQAEPLLREALAQRRALLGNANASTADTIDHLATLLQEQDKYAEAEPLFREALERRRAILGPDQQDVGASLNNLALLLFLEARYDEAEPLYREAVAIYERRLGPDHPETAITVQNLAQVQQFRRHFDEAEALYRRALAAKRKALGNAHPTVTVTLDNLGDLLAREQGKVDEAESLVREALALDRQMFGERHGYVAASLDRLGTVLRAKGDFDEAERLTRQALEINRSLYGTEHRAVATDLVDIGTLLYLKGDLAGAIPPLRESKAMFARLGGEGHRSTVGAAVTLARALREHGDAAEAERLLREASGYLDATKPAQLNNFLAVQVGLGQTLTDEGRVSEALPILQRAYTLSRASFRADDWRMAHACLAYGAALAAAGDGARAEPLLRQAHDILEPQRRTQPRLAAQADAALAVLASHFRSRG